MPFLAKIGLQTEVQDVFDLKMDLDDSGVPIDDTEYETMDDKDKLVTPEMHNSKNPPDGLPVNIKPTTS